MFAPVIVLLFDFNYAPIRRKPLVRRKKDTFKTVNGHLKSALGSEKYRKTENVGALHDR